MKPVTAVLALLGLLASCGGNSGEAGADGNDGSLAPADGSALDASDPSDGATASADASDTDGVVDGQNPPNHSPVASSGVFHVEALLSGSGQLLAEDADNDPVTFGVVSQPAQGEITELDPRTGAFAYRSLTATTGTDSFTFTASDAIATSAPATIEIQIVPVNFSGSWSLSGSCTTSSVRISHYSNVLVVNGYSYKCGNTTTTIKRQVFDVVAGKLQQDGKTVGSITPVGFSVRQSAYVSGCGTVTKQLSLTVGSDGAILDVTISAACVANQHFVHTATRDAVPDPVVLAALPLPALSFAVAEHDFGQLTVGGQSTKTFVIANSGAGEATGVSPTDLDAPFALSGGYPGTGGTCGATLAPGSSCTVAVTVDRTAIGAHEATLRLDYYDGLRSQQTEGLSLRFNVEPAVTNPTHVAAGYYATCVLHDGGAYCWGEGPVADALPPTLDDPTAIAVGQHHACALDATGVVCWGSNASGQTDVPSLSNPSQISTYGTHTCALGQNGVTCWGSDNHGKATVPSLVNPTAVAAGGNHACALDDTGVVCWGNNWQGESTPPPLSNPRAIDTGDSVSCAVDDTGVVCWGWDFGGVVSKPPLGIPGASIVQLSVGQFHGCIRTADVACWGYSGDGRTLVPAGNGGYTEVSAGRQQSCGISAGKLVCWGAY